MRVRAMTPSGDYQFGFSTGQFLVDSPDAVAQLIGTRLRLMQGEWFLDTTEGTARMDGRGNQAENDLAVQDRILNTPGVLEISEFSSTVDTLTRAYRMSATVLTQYGSTTVSL